MEAEGAEDTIDKQSSSERMREVYSATDTGWRADLVEEIKDLNMRRSVFDDRPLDEQIIHLERLMEKLDSRVDRLKSLGETTKLSSQFKELIKQFKSFMFRDKSDVKLVYKNKEARHLRKALQIQKYGRKYREGIHSQMQRMEKYIEIVSQKQKDYAAYKSFVKELENRLEVETLQKQGTDSHSLTSSKIISTEEANRKLHLRSAFIKEHFKEEGILDQSAKLRNTSNNDTARPKKQNPAKQIESEADSKSAGSNTKQKQQDRAQGSNRYYIPPSENMRSFAQEVDAHIEEDRKRKGFAPFRKAGEEGLKSSFNYRDEPTKFTTTAESHRKRKETAEKMREKVPPEYRAEPYSEEELQAERERKANKQSSHQGKEGAFKNFTEGFKSKWEDVMKAAKGDDAADAPKKKRRAKMSGQFNQASGAEDRAQGSSYEYYDGFDFDI